MLPIFVYTQTHMSSKKCSSALEIPLPMPDLLYEIKFYASVGSKWKSCKAKQWSNEKIYLTYMQIPYRLFLLKIQCYHYFMYSCILITKTAKPSNPHCMDNACSARESLSLLASILGSMLYHQLHGWDWIWFVYLSPSRL